MKHPPDQRGKKLGKKVREIGYHWSPLADSCHGFSLEVDLVTKEVQLAHDEDEEYGSAIHGSLDDIEDPPDIFVDSRHRLLGSTICSFNCG